MRGSIGEPSLLLSFSYDLFVELDVFAWYSFEVWIGIEVDVVETEVGLMVEGVTPLAIRGERPTEVGRNRNATLTDFRDFIEMGSKVFAAEDSVRNRDAAVLNDHNLLIREPTMKTLEGLAESLGPDWSIEEASFTGFDEAVELMELIGGQAPVVIHAYKVMRAVGLGRTEAFREFASTAEIPPIRIGKASRRARESPDFVEFSNSGLKRF